MLAGGRQRRETSDGIEYDLAVSYLSRYIILREVASTLGGGPTKAGSKAPRIPHGISWRRPDRLIDDFNSERAFAQCPVPRDSSAVPQRMQAPRLKPGSAF